MTIGMEHDGGCDHRPGQTATADLVAAGDVHESHTAQRILQRARRRNSGHVMGGMGGMARIGGTGVGPLLPFQPFLPC